MKKTLLLFAFVVALFGFQSDARSWTTKWEVMGFGLSYPETPYKGVDNKVIPSPIIKLEAGKFFIDVIKVGYYLNSPEESLRFGIIGAPHFGGYEAEDSDDLSGMEDRDWGFDSGLRMKWRNEVFDLNMDAVTDISGTSKGQQVDLTISKVFFHGFLTPRIGVTWQSKDSVDYYYGVRANEAAVGRSEYLPSSELEYMVGIRLGFPIGENWALMGDVQASFLGDEVKDSPIVDESTLMRYTLGLVYRF